MWWTALTEALPNLIGKVLDKFAVDKNVKAEIEKELALVVYREVDSARELARAEILESDPKFVKVLRALPRPTIALIAVFFWVFSKFRPDLIELNPFDYAAIIGVFTFYFGSRLYEKNSLLKLFGKDFIGKTDVE